MSDVIDPVMDVALSDLTLFVFEGRPAEGEAVSDGHGKAGAVHLFKHFKYHGYDWSAETVRAWAEAHGWPRADADKLAEYSQGVHEGVRYHTAPDPWGRHHMSFWRERVASAEQQPPDPDLS